jgi:pimeloyl-ACP methyl ester carboxylesterase
MPSRLARSVRIGVGDVRLDADLTVPPTARGLVVFAHGTGSSRVSPRNRHVARVLEAAPLATLLLDLLATDEEADWQTGLLRFDVALLAERLVAATDWTLGDLRVAGLPVGYFGASTGAAAALIAATRRPELVKAVVSRGGRPDLASDALAAVTAPTLLIVGGQDAPVLALNRDALTRLRAEAELEIVPGATHLFEEPGALDKVARLARRWFDRYLIPNTSAGRPRRPAA